MSDPISPLHVSRSALDAGAPSIWFAAYNVVAALPLPPPRPAPCGTLFSRCTAKWRLLPVLRRSRLSACWARGGVGGGEEARIEEGGDTR